MIEPLTDDSRLILSFIRDHPGLTRIDIFTYLRMNKFDVTMAIKQLMHNNLIFRIQSEIGPDFKVRYYPS